MPAAIIRITPYVPWKCIRRKVLCRKYQRLKLAVCLDTFGKGVSQTRTRIVGEREANMSETSQTADICYQSKLTDDARTTADLREPGIEKGITCGRTGERKKDDESVSFVRVQCE